MRVGVLSRSGWDANLQSTVSGESHFQESNQQTSVTTVVTGENFSFLQQLLLNFDGFAKECRIVHSWRALTKLREGLCQHRSTNACLALSEIYQEERGLSGKLDVRRNFAHHVVGRTVAGHHQRTGGFDHLVATLCRHAQTVLPTIDGHTQNNHHIAQRLAGLVHGGAFVFEFRRPHPVSGTLDVIQGCQLDPANVGQHLSDGELCHGLRAQKPFNRLFADGSDCSFVAEKRARDHSAVCQRKLKWSNTLLLCNSSSHRPIHLVGEEAFRRYREMSEDSVHAVLQGRLARL
mmetsp:Transcript_5726/g.14543  ORF Transcript_5726/g.14543 Transcript_5726/m.14543 type:complete len:291 (-) Transcript_5726:2208-3080(-)